MVDLSGKIAFVSGAAQGMGAGISQVMAECGATVVMTGRGKNVFETAEKIKGTVEPLLMDVSDEAHVAEVSKYVLDRYGHVDILVNNAGILLPVDPRTMETSCLDAHYQTNVRGCWFCTRAFLPQMLDRRYGRIINISSVTGTRVADPGMMAYSMSKGAILAITKATAIEGAPYGVTANAILPGYIRTNMVQKTANAYNPDDHEEFYRVVSKGIPMGRVGTSLEVGYLAAFLASDEAAYITGGEHLIDGGHSLPETLATSGPYAPVE